MGVNIPPILAPYAIPRAKRNFSFLLSLKKSAIGSKRRVVVVLDSTEDKSPEVIMRAKIIPFALLGNRPNILLAIHLCNLVFSTAIASKKPPKKR